MHISHFVTQNAKKACIQTYLIKFINFIASSKMILSKTVFLFIFLQ